MGHKRENEMHTGLAWGLIGIFTMIVGLDSLRNCGVGFFPQP